MSVREVYRRRRTGPEYFQGCAAQAPRRRCCAAATHSFHKSEADWGFSDYINLEVLRTGGWLRNDELTFRVSVRVNTLDSSCYDSKKETGYVGLRNQGECYLQADIRHTCESGLQRAPAHLLCPFPNQQAPPATSTAGCRRCSTSTASGRCSLLLSALVCRTCTLRMLPR